MSEAEMTVLSPTGKRKTWALPLAPRPTDLQGKTVGLVENGAWWTTSRLLQRLGELLKERCGVGEVVYVNELKEDFHSKRRSGSLPDETVKELAGNWDAVIVGLGN